MLTCFRLCISLYCSDGFPIRGMPDKCLCAEKIDKTTLPPLPITLTFPKEHEEPKRDDNRAERVYEVEE